MRRLRILDLFCGAGGATKGYQMAGFWVRGVDIARQPRYVGEQFIQADALEYLSGLIKSGEIEEFDAVHASPPCQAHSALRNRWNARSHEDLIPETRVLLHQCELPFIMENVPGAPLEDAPLFGTFRMMLCGTMFELKTNCGAQLQRHRFFELNWQSGQPPTCRHSGVDKIGVTGSGAPVGSKQGVIGVYSGHVRDRRRTITVTGSTPQQNVERNKVRKVYSIGDAKTAMGIDWMPMSHLSQAIPPAYTEFIGRQLSQYIERSQAAEAA